MENLNVPNLISNTTIENITDITPNMRNLSSPSISSLLGTTSSTSTNQTSTASNSNKSSALPALSTSSIHISRNWKLPERLKPGRKPMVKKEQNQSRQFAALSNANIMINNNFTSSNDIIPSSMAPDANANTGSIGSSNSGSNSPISSPGYLNNSNVTLPALLNTDSKHLLKDIISSNDECLNQLDDDKLPEPLSTKTESAARRRKQNREAQRAYRERKANRIQVLEETVDMLQSTINNWDSKYKKLQKEYIEDKSLLSRSLLENEKLKIQIESLCKQSAEHNYTTQPLPSSPSNVEDESLQNIIDNFKPMKAISLKSKKKATGDLPSLEVWTPGSCANCKADPNGKAFCKAIYKKNKNPMSIFPTGKGPEDATSSSSCASQKDGKRKGGCCGTCSEKKQYVAISDTYQRIRKHMNLENPVDHTGILQLQNSSSSKRNSALIDVLEKVSTDLEINGREVEIKSVKKAINNLHKD